MWILSTSKLNKLAKWSMVISYLDFELMIYQQLKFIHITWLTLPDVMLSLQHNAVCLILQYDIGSACKYDYSLKMRMHAKTAHQTVGVLLTRITWNQFLAIPISPLWAWIPIKYSAYIYLHLNIISIDIYSLVQTNVVLNKKFEMRLYFPCCNWSQIRLYYETTVTKA